MNDLNKVLGDISVIRRQIAKTTEFRGYGPATLASTGILAILAATSQSFWLPDPASHISGYLTIWIVTAALSILLIGIRMYTRTRRMHSELSNEMLRLAVEQFLPSVGTGLLVTIVLMLHAPQVLWMLPGLWQIFSGIGVFSSCRFLPRPMVLVGAWYLFTGLSSLAMGDRALSPWAMGIAYCAGQLMMAAILQFHASEVEDEG
ncbi:MAG: hypothetical protein FWD64_10175 [Acidobacteriaceae bacterium]|nr:hypothetical protein [Acidobacteriaceae bacterium]